MQGKQNKLKITPFKEEKRKSTELVQRASLILQEKSKNLSYSPSMTKKKIFEVRKKNTKSEFYPAEGEILKPKNELLLVPEPFLEEYEIGETLGKVSFHNEFIINNI